MTFRADWLPFRRFAALTTGLTLWLITLGIFTAATGSGLACQAQWPLCSDQYVPALTLNPNFIEWFHRVWAMAVGFFILGTAAWAWFGGADRRTRLASAFAVVLLPLQIAIGAITVTVGGLVPGGYAVPTHAAHLLVALSIFTLLGLTTLFAYEPHHRRPPLRRAELALSVALVGVLLGATTSRAVPLFTYRPTVQGVYFAVSLVAYLAFAAALYWLPSSAGRARTAAAGAWAALVATMLLGRDLLLYTEAVRTANLALVGASLALVGGAVWLVRRERGDRTEADAVAPAGD